MQLLQKYKLPVNRSLTSEARQSFLLGAACLGLVLTGLACLLVWEGAPAMSGRPWDLPASLDGAWRILHGQAPHRDFYSHLGAFPFWVTALGMKLSHPCVSAIVYGNVVLMLLVGSTVFIVACRRTSALYAFIFSLFLATLVVSPRPFGDPHDSINFAMHYNRLGEALLALFSVLVFISPRPGVRRGWPELLEAAFAGVLATALWFTKLNYFTIAVVFLGIAAGLRFLQLRMALVCAISALASASVLLSLSHIPVGAMLRDFQIMAGAQSFASKAAKTGMLAVNYALLLPLLLLYTWERFCNEPGSSQRRWAALRDAAVLTAFFAGALLLIGSNHQVKELPLLATAALCGAETIRRQRLPEQTDLLIVSTRNLAAFCLWLFFLLPTLTADLESIRSQTLVVLKKRDASTDVLKTTNLADWRFDREGSGQRADRDYAEFLDEGIQLLRRHCVPNKRLVVIMFANPFHVALGLPPSAGGCISLVENTFNRRSHPPLQRLLADADYLLADAGCGQLREVYGDELDRIGLEKVEEAKYVVLFRRNKVPRP